MIEDVTGIQRIRMLYLQLLYRCNFECLFCFHGERLSHADAFTREEAIGLMRLMRDNYGTETVTLLGGEPFLYKELSAVVRHAKQELGLRVEICTNGYRIGRRLVEIAPHLDLLRVSLEGVGATNDALRRTGSYREALATLEAARELGVATGTTMTVNARNSDHVVLLARTLQELGVGQLKLHALRPVGNAANRPELTLTDPETLAHLHDELRSANLDMEVVFDEDLAPGCASGGSAAVPGQLYGLREIERIECDPRGALTMSCKAVGKDAHAFWYDKAVGTIVHRPSADDELALAIPDVVYAHV